MLRNQLDVALNVGGPASMVEGLVTRSNELFEKAKNWLPQVLHVVEKTRYVVQFGLHRCLSW